MKLLFPAAKPKQIEVLSLFGIHAQAFSLTIYHEPFSFESIEADLKKRVMARARTVSDKQVTGHLLSCESVIVFRKKIYETPRFKMDALNILQNLNGRSHMLLTYWLVKNIKTGKLHEGFSETKVMLKKIDDDLLEGYVNDHDVVHWVGGYEPYQTPFIEYIDRLDGSFSGFLYNLPIEQVVPVLQQER